MVLDAGDLFFKKFFQPIPQNELKMATDKAHLIIESLNLMGYDAVGIGDDDLSLGKDLLLELSKKANSPFLSSNIIDEGSGKLLFQPYILKEINGLRIGIFSLFSPDVFWGQSDLRRKGLIFQPYIEAAHAMIKELQPKTDLIILLSHLSYPKDMELAQTVSGIHLIIGSHTGMNLAYPPVVKNTLILQTVPKGMYAGRLDLTFYNNDPGFYNIMTKKSMESSLYNLNNRLNSTQATEAEKAQWRRAKEDTERALGQLQGKNEFINNIIPLTELIKDHPTILKMVEAYRPNLTEVQKSPSPSSPPAKETVSQ